MKNWQVRTPPGAAVNHPAIPALCSRAPGIHPERSVIDGRTFVAYRRTRFYLDRAAWEMLPPDGILVMFVDAPGGSRCVFALNRTELESVFGSVRETGSWNTVRCYHFPSIPPAAWSFLVQGAVGYARAAVAAENSIANQNCDFAAAQSPFEALLPSQTNSTGAGKFPSVSPFIPADASIEQWSGAWASYAGMAAESAEYLRSVKAWRDAWRPIP